MHPETGAPTHSTSVAQTFEKEAVSNWPVFLDRVARNLEIPRQMRDNNGLYLWHPTVLFASASLLTASAFSYSEISAMVRC
jgi:hypothetical protein